MAIKYIETADLLIFPATRRSSVQPSARYQQESSYAGIIQRLADYNDGSFILTQPTSVDTQLVYDGDEPFEFFIHGYWFRIAKLSDIIADSTFDNSLNIYAYIDLDDYIVTPSTDTNLQEHKYELRGRDENIEDSSVYTGLKISDTAVTGTNRYILHLFNRTDTTTAWNISVVQNSLMKINSNNINLDIDGGIIK